MSYQKIKRILDIFGSCILLILLGPVFLIVSLVIRLNLGKPILFRQLRPGLNNEVFRLYKFRTMINIDHGQGLVSDRDRLTKLGKFLRSSSIDELPSLWNVLKGEMSFVGPRPLLVQYLDHYTPAQAVRHQTRPGITGLAQVQGRNSLSWDEKFELDAQYVARLSMKLDLLILLRTFLVVLRRDGISHDGEATMPIFDGSEL